MPVSNKVSAEMYFNPRSREGSDVFALCFAG